jgi:predicted DNA-binding protein
MIKIEVFFFNLEAYFEKLEDFYLLETVYKVLPQKIGTYAQNSQ